MNEIVKVEENLPVKTQFFCLDQNNSGGSFDFDEEYGITHKVIIEFTDRTDLDNRIEEILSYPNRGYDCPCCGARWSTWVSEYDISDTPCVYGQPVAIYGAETQFKWMEEGKEVCVHYIDGRKEWF